MRLIDADAMKDTNDNVIVVIDPETKSKYLISLSDYINAQPTVDPVKHGHWVIADLDGYDIECSNCHNEGPYGMDAEDVLEIPYCPWCGARMDEVAE